MTYTMTDGQMNAATTDVIKFCRIVGTVSSGECDWAKRDMLIEYTSIAAAKRVSRCASA